MLRSLFDPPEADCPRCAGSRMSWGWSLAGPLAFGFARLCAWLGRSVLPIRVKCAECGLSFSHLHKERRSVVGYHGCKRAFADRLVAGSVRPGDWETSRNDYDWLGEGIYFWEDAPERAWQWARYRYKDEAAVVATEIRLGRCMDLADTAFVDLLRGAYRDIVDAYQGAGLSLPKNEGKEQKLRRLDRLVIDRVTESMDTPEGKYFQTVRAPFEEGEPMFPGAMLRTLSHIQIAVRDHRCIGPSVYRVLPGGKTA
ncbi:MAG: hypothetical protein K2W96_04300 [Gemmataceae bacterium]|nr:hypothetical protein [Gemmataceae bacterium]